MAFWGMEVKPGKPFAHITDSKRGRLHISQATLGFGMGTKKSVVQCNVGNRSPVLLCCLFPEQAESCQLNLEFEEADEVIFSVIGPRSVHLTGYYLGGSRHYKLDDESESYGEDIAETEAERSSDASDEDEYEDSFIDDGDPQVTLSSPASADGVTEETLHKRKKKNEKPRYRRLRKRYQFSQTDDDCTSQEHTFANGRTCTPVLDSESEDMTTISSFFKSAARSRKPEMEEKAEKETGQTINKEMKDGDNCSAIAARNADGVVDSEHKRQPDQCESILPSAGVNSENGTKSKKKLKKQLKEEKELKAGEEDDFFFGKVLKWSKAQENDTKADQSGRDMAVMNGEAKRTGNDKGENPLHLSLPSNELFHGKSEKRKKKRAKEEKAPGAESLFYNISRKDEAQPDEARCENMEQYSLLGNKSIQKHAHDENTVLSCSMMLGHEDGLKPKKKRKKSTEDKTLEADRKHNKIVEDEKASQDELKSDGIKCDNSLRDEQNQMQAINDIFDKNADQSGNENHSRKKKKKKKSRTQENRDAMNMDESMNTSFMDIKDSNADEKSSQSRTLSVGVEN